MRFTGSLVFETARACKAALRAMAEDEEGCLAESAVQPEDLRVDGRRLSVDVHTSASASSFELSCHLLETLAEDAESGEILAVYDPGEGEAAVLTERIVAGEEEEAPDPEEVWRDAVRIGDLDTIERSLAQGRSPTELLGITWSAAAIDRLVAAGADPRAEGLYAVVDLAQLGQTAALERLLAAGADPNARRGASGETGLMMAAYHGKTPAVRALLAAGADPNASDHSGATALHWAVGNTGKSRLQTVRALLLAGADPARPDKQGQTPAGLASRRGYADVLTLLGG